MPYTFDTLINRRNSDSVKWNLYDADVLPMWVADMDFRSPDVVIQALRERVDHGFFGYTFDAAPLRQVIVDRLRERSGFEIAPEHLVFLPNLVTGLNLITSVIGEPGGSVLMLTPMYPPFLSTVNAQHRVLNNVELAKTQQDGVLRYEIDFDALEAAVTPETKLFLFCNPHNPIGRVYTRAELERIAEFCIRHDLILCSDEIHSDLVHAPHRHIPIASLSPEIAARTMTLIAPSKTFNLPSLGCGIAIITDDALRKRFETRAQVTGEHAYLMGMVGAEAAYAHGQPWLDELLPYLTANRDTVVEYVRENLPGVEVTCPEGTYLAWLDFNRLNLPKTPAEFFLEAARVAYTDGAMFGKGGEGFIRLNFGCPRPMLLEALDRTRRALETVVAG